MLLDKVRPRARARKRLFGLGDDFTDINLSDPFAGASIGSNTWAAPTGSSLGPAMTDTAQSPVSGGFPDSAAGPSFNFSDIANGVAKVLPALAQTVATYKLTSQAIAARSPVIPTAYNPVYSPYYGPAAPAYPGLTMPAAGSNTLFYVALGIAGLLVLKGLGS